MSSEHKVTGGPTAWPMVLVIVILAAVVSIVAIVRRQAVDPDATPPDRQPAIVLLQHLAFLAMVSLFAWHQRRVLIFLLKLGARNWFIGAEIVLLLAIVYGAFGSFGLPELFWDDSLLTVGVAGFSAAVFVALAWFAIYLVDHSRPVRNRTRRLAWAGLEPIVVESGLPWLSRLPTAGLSPRWQVGWFLAIACLPGWFLLALPAFLPGIRPSSDPRAVEWTWLAGLVLGAMFPYIVLLARPVPRLLTRLRTWRGKPIDPGRAETAFQWPGVLLWNLGAVYVLALLLDRIEPRSVVLAFLLCLVLAFVAVAGAYFLSIRKRSNRVWVLLLAVAAIALNGVQTYDPCYRGLEAYYPPDPLRQIVRLSSPFSRSDDSTPVNLVAFQERDAGGAARAAAERSRTAMLDAWKASFQHQDEPGARTTVKPVLVLVTASGGALRAGLWTAAVLDAVQQKIPEFPRHVRFITGASGGMVGAALFVTSRAQGAAAGADTRPELAGKRLPDRFSSDYLSPLARQFILRDIPLFLFPWRQSYDRGHALEDAFAEDGGLSELAYTFSRLKDLEQRGLIPSIIFSPMLVEDGRRLLISNLELADVTTIDGENLLAESRVEIVDRIEKTSGTRLTRRDSLEFQRINAVPAVEFFRLFPLARESFRVATAVRMNATFPVVTPTGIIPTDSPRQVVDAGYYDNYGVDLATALIFAHREWIAANTSGVLVIQVRAFRNEKQLKVLDEPVLSRGLVNTASNFVDVLARGIRWITSPVNGLAEARQAVMHYRNDGQLLMLSRYFRDRAQLGPDFLKTVVFTCSTEIESTDEQQVETLNWHLSEKEMVQIKKNMRTRDQNQIRLQKLAEWWQQRMHPGRD